MSLSGVRVVTMALNAPGPLAAARLASEGAEVIKVEPPSGDPLREICRSWYDELHAQQRVERIDLKSAEGRAWLDERLRNADVFLSSQRPAALARLGLHAASLTHVRWLNIVGDRNEPETPGHDLTYQATAGLLGDTMPVTILADVMGSQEAYAAVLLLLRQPVGSHAQVGLYQSLYPLVAPLKHGMTRPGDLLGGGLPAYNIYPTREGRVAVAALEPHFRARLYSALQLAPESDLGPIMLTRSAGEWEAWAAAHDLPLARVNEHFTAR